MTVMSPTLARNTEVLELNEAEYGKYNSDRVKEGAALRSSPSIFDSTHDSQALSKDSGLVSASA
jgi:hypothetical protein